MGVLISKAHDREAGYAQAAARDQHHRFAIVDQLADTLGSVMPAQPRFDEIARHAREDWGVAAAGEAQADVFRAHACDFAMMPELRASARLWVAYLFSARVR